MISRTFLTVVALGLILPLGTYAANLNPEESQQPDNIQIAQMVSQKGKGWQGQGMKKFLEQLDLTGEQSAQIEAISNRYRTTNEQDYEELKQAKEEMRSLLTTDANSNQLRQQHQKMQSLRQKLGDSRFEAMLEVRQILTSEQRQQMADIMAQHRGRRGYKPRDN